MAISLEMVYKSGLTIHYMMANGKMVNEMVLVFVNGLMIHSTMVAGKMILLMDLGHL